MRKRLVISAVNFTEGGPLTILREAVASASSFFGEEWDITVLAHSADLINDGRAEVRPFPFAKRSWISRLRHEWFIFKEVSNQIKPDLWLSLHDITPRVSVKRQAVYCHNPSPFYAPTVKEAMLEPSLFLFSLFYSFLYRINIKKNHSVIVQQDWLRKEFRKRYKVESIIVAHPESTLRESQTQLGTCDMMNFFFPALPRVFKNHQVIGEAVKILKSRGRSGFTASFTLSGNENGYAASLLKAYSRFKEIRFIGRLSRDEMVKAYQEAAAVVFPSKLETWGLPISEAQVFNKLLIAADLPYAHETVGQYQDVVFFNPSDSTALANIMESVLDGFWQPTGNKWNEPAQPYTASWAELWAMLSQGL